MKRRSESEWQAYFKEVRPREEETRLVKSRWTVFWVATVISAVIMILIAAANGRF